MSLQMLTRLGRHHDNIKEFGEAGTPIRECFYKQVSNKRVKEHLGFLMEEKVNKGEISLTALNKEAILADNLKQFSKQLRKRGYYLF